MTNSRNKSTNIDRNKAVINNLSITDSRAIAIQRIVI